MMKHGLNEAKKRKDDEYYTDYKDIAAEMELYMEELKGKWVYCPCDDHWSNFWKYFVDNFEKHGLKHLTATHIEFDKPNSYRLDYDGKEITKTPLTGNGDFRSPECTKIKDECDIVITNPPFSLFKDFYNWLKGEDVFCPGVSVPLI